MAAVKLPSFLDCCQPDFTPASPLTVYGYSMMMSGEPRITSGSSASVSLSLLRTRSICATSSSFSHRESDPTNLWSWVASRLVNELQPNLLADQPLGGVLFLLPLLLYLGLLLHFVHHLLGFKPLSEDSLQNPRHLQEQWLLAPSRDPYALLWRA